MNSLRVLVGLLALATIETVRAQLVQVELTGEVLVRHKTLPWQPVSHVSGPVPFQIDALFDASLSPSSDGGDFDEKRFYPENELSITGFRIRFADADWGVPLRQIDQTQSGSFGLWYYDRFSFIHAVVEFGDGALGRIDQLIRPEFPSLSPSFPVGHLDGFMIGIGELEGSIASVDARWFTPVPEASILATTAAGLLIVTVFWRRRRKSMLQTTE